MKIISIILICILPLVSCQPHVMPTQIEADIPIDPEPVRKPVSSEKRQRVGGLSNSQMAALGIGAAAFGALALSKKDCNDCGADGVVHKGDPHTRKIWIFKKAYRCPVCEGQGHL